MSKPFTINIYNVPSTNKPSLLKGNTAAVDVRNAITSAMTYDTDHWTVTIDDGYDATPFNIFAVGFIEVECAYYINSSIGNNTRNIYMISKSAPRDLFCWHTCVAYTDLSWKVAVHFDTEDLYTETPNPTTSSKLFLRDGTEVNSADFVDADLGTTVPYFNLANSNYIGFSSSAGVVPVGGNNWTFARNSAGDITGQLHNIYAYSDTTLTEIPVYAWACVDSTFMPDLMIGGTVYTREVPAIGSSVRTCGKDGTYSLEGTLQRTDDTTGVSTGLGYTYTYTRDPDNDFIATPQTVYTGSLSSEYGQIIYNDNGEDAKLRVQTQQNNNVTVYEKLRFRQKDPVQESAITTAQSLWRDVAFGSNKFVAIDGYGKFSTASYVGTSWSAPVDPSLGLYAWAGVLYDGTQFVAFSATGPYISTSTDGTTWSTPVNTNPGLNESWKYMIYDGTKYILIGLNGHVVTSTDLTSWTNTGTDLGTNSWYSIAYNGSKYVALTQKGRLAYSTDCVNWSSLNNNTVLTVDDKWYTIKPVGSMFMTLSTRGYYSFSDDGENWSVPKNIVYTTTPSTTTTDWRAICPAISSLNNGIILMSGWGMVCQMKKI